MMQLHSNVHTETQNSANHRYLFPKAEFNCLDTQSNANQRTNVYASVYGFFKTDLKC